MKKLLSEILAEAAEKAKEAIPLPWGPEGDAPIEEGGPERDEAIEEIRTLMSEARDEGFYHRDDHVETVELLLAKERVDATDLREIRAKLDVLVRCAEWVEAAKGISAG